MFKWIRMLCLPSFQFTVHTPESSFLKDPLKIRTIFLWLKPYELHLPQAEVRIVFYSRLSLIMYVTTKLWCNAASSPCRSPLYRCDSGRQWYGHLYNWNTATKINILPRYILYEMHGPYIHCKFLGLSNLLWTSHTSCMWSHSASFSVH